MRLDTQVADISDLRMLRARLESAFSLDTANVQNESLDRASSSGHCAAVSAIVSELFCAQLVSSIVQGQSHWFNRLQVDGAACDVDLTADQFGRSALLVGPPGTLYDGTRVRLPTELKSETIARAALLAQRSGLLDAATRLRSRLGKDQPS